MRFARLAWALGMVAVASLGCSGADPSPTDAGGDASVDAGVEPPMLEVDPPAAPLPPELPRLAPCPTGFRATTEGELTVCDAFPETGREACAHGAFHLPGSPGCAPIGSACPSDEWAAVDGLASVAFVRAGAAPGGDGSRAAPFATIAEALAATPRADVIALARGTYAETVDLPAAANLVGACPSETSIAPAAPAGPTIRVAGGSAAIRDITIDAGAPAIVVEDGADVALAGIVIRGASGAAIVVRGGSRASAHGLLVRDVVAGATGGGHALDVTDAMVEVSDAVIVRATEHAITVAGPAAALRLERVDVRDTQSRATDGLLGLALQVSGGAGVVIEESIFEGNRDKALRVDDEGSTLRVVRSIVRGTAARDSDGLLGFGLAVANGASVELERVDFDRNGSMAIAVQHVGSTLSVVDSVVRDTRPSSLGDVGHGVDVQNGALATLERVAILRSTSAGVFASQSSIVTAEDLRVSDTFRRPSDDALGFGVRARDLARVTLRRAWIERSHGAGVVASAASDVAEVGPRLDLQDVLVSNTDPAANGSLGAGVAVAVGELFGRRVAIERSRGGGVMAAYAGSTSLEDVRVTDVSSAANDGALGAGLVFFEGHSAAVHRVTVERTRAVGLWAAEGADVAGSHVVVRATGEADCGDCDRGGFGLAAHRSALSLTDFVVEDSALCGVAVGPEAEVDLERGLVARNPIGANVQPPDYDLDRISRDVVYRDNDIALDTSSLPAPTFSLFPEP